MIHAKQQWHYVRKHRFISIHFQKYGIFMVHVVLLWYMSTEQWYYDHMSKNVSNVSPMIRQRLYMSKSQMVV